MDSSRSLLEKHCSQFLCEKTPTAPSSKGYAQAGSLDMTKKSMAEIFAAVADFCAATKLVYLNEGLP